MTAPVCPSLPQNRPSQISGTNGRVSGGAPVAPDHVVPGRDWWGGLSTGSDDKSAPQSPPQSPKVTDLLRKTFGATIPWYLSAEGREVGTLPDWTAWPSVKLSEMGPPPRTQPELARDSLALKRRPT